MRATLTATATTSGPALAATLTAHGFTNPDSLTASDWTEAARRAQAPATPEAAAIAAAILDVANNYRRPGCDIRGRRYHAYYAGRKAARLAAVLREVGITTAEDVALMDDERWSMAATIATLTGETVFADREPLKAPSDQVREIIAAILAN